MTSPTHADGDTPAEVTGFIDAVLRGHHTTADDSETHPMAWDPATPHEPPPHPNTVTHWPADPALTPAADVNHGVADGIAAPPTTGTSAPGTQVDDGIAAILHGGAHPLGQHPATQPSWTDEQAPYDPDQFILDDATIDMVQRILADPDTDLAMILGLADEHHQPGTNHNTHTNNTPTYPTAGQLPPDQIPGTFWNPPAAQPETPFDPDQFLSDGFAAGFPEQDETDSRT